MAEEPNCWKTMVLWCHNKLRQRKPEAASLSQATSFNRYNVPPPCPNLSGISEKHKFTPDNNVPCEALNK
jgi:hypothetical protein